MLDHLLFIRRASPPVIFACRLIIAIILYGLLLCIVDLKALTGQLAELDWGWLVLGVVIQVQGIVLSALRWQLVLAKLQIKRPYLQLLLRYWSGTFYSLVLPGNVGGDVVRVGGLVRQGVPLATSTISVLADRLIGLWTLILLGLICSLWPSDLPYRGLLCLAFGGIVMGGVLVIRCLPVGHRYVSAALRRYLASAELIRAGKQQRFVALVLGFQLLVVVHFYAIAQAVHAPVSFLAAGLYVPAVVLVTMLPISLSGIGIREVSLMALLIGLGVPHETAVLMGTLIVTTSIISALPGGFAILAFPREYDRGAPSIR